ncbi:integrase core domain-containing protein [Novosphingobium sp. HII-3]|uniref:integrase core domain-containing protein n=1 Tax=Novosphingobium TaxID=165696 RepID=UPI0011AFAECA
MDSVSDALFNGKRFRALTSMHIRASAWRSASLRGSKANRWLMSWIGSEVDGQCLCESFNGRPRDECLNTHWFLSSDDARSKIKAWRTDFNKARLHTSPGS